MPSFISLLRPPSLNVAVFIFYAIELAMSFDLKKFYNLMIFGWWGGWRINTLEDNVDQLGASSEPASIYDSLLKSRPIVPLKNEAELSEAKDYRAYLLRTLNSKSIPAQDDAIRLYLNQLDREIEIYNELSSKTT